MFMEVSNYNFTNYPFYMWYGWRKYKDTDAYMYTVQFKGNIMSNCELCLSNESFAKLCWVDLVQYDNNNIWKTYNLTIS